MVLFPNDCLRASAGPAIMKTKEEICPAFPGERRNMAGKKLFQELEFKDAFLFALTMEDEEICRGVLERILEIPVKKVKVQSENTLLVNWWTRDC